jgi:hypothetical protein
VFKDVSIIWQSKNRRSFRIAQLPDWSQRTALETFKT